MSASQQRRLTLREKMVALYPRTHGPECPDRYRAIAEWWRLHAEESAHPDEPLAWADAADRIADDMASRLRRKGSR